MTFRCGDELTVIRRGDDLEKDWWWAKRLPSEEGASTLSEGYIPRNLLGLYPRVRGLPPPLPKVGGEGGPQMGSAGVEPMAEESQTITSN